MTQKTTTKNYRIEKIKQSNGKYKVRIVGEIVVEEEDVEPSEVEGVKEWLIGKLPSLPNFTSNS